MIVIKMTSDAVFKYEVRSRWSARQKIVLLIACLVITAALAAFAFSMFAGEKLEVETGHAGQSEGLEEVDDIEHWDEHDDEDFDPEDEDDYD